MTRKPLRWGGYIALSLAFAGVAVAHSDWISDTAEALRDLPRCRETVAYERERQESLEDRHTATRRRMAIKEAFVEEYAADRITFEALVEEFELLNAQAPAITPHLRWSFPGDTVTEQTAYNLALHVIQLSNRIERPELEAQVNLDLEAFLTEARPGVTGSGVSTKWTVQMGLEYREVPQR